MTLVTFLATYVMIWWIVFFMVLPWGNRASHDVSPGFDPGAPEKPRLWLKVGLVSLITTLICLGLHLSAGSWMPELILWFKDG